MHVKKVTKEIFNFVKREREKLGEFGSLGQWSLPVE
jgi:hypothetical protein